MGMAASQARYLALTARKSNCEYEGQQINQQRLTLSNQSANLFNQMLGLSVPVPPSTSDYTKLQYSYSDGTNDSVISSWNQLSTADPNYNYVVTHYYYTDKYTGSLKKLSDPQVQYTQTGTPATQAEIDEALAKITATYAEYTAAQEETQKAKANLETLTQYSTSQNLIDAEYDKTNDIYTVNGTDSKTYTYTAYSNITDEAQKAAIDEAIETLQDNGALDTKFDTSNIYYDTTNGKIAFKSDLSSLNGITTGDNTKLNLYGTGDTGSVATADAKLQLEYETAKTTETTKLLAYNAAKDEYDKLNHPTYVGNCELTPLVALSESQATELKQVVKDMTEQEIDCNIRNCFDTEGNYTGGVYSFTMNGTTYYTTLDDLNNSYQSGTGNNNIDGQQKLTYYNASYISTKVEKTEKALMETDGNGRFSSIRFEDDSVTYTLNAETITDENAYNDAMNQYNYESAVYDKTVQDINAKTSLIQQQDQVLELRLKQLETEQNALSTEMDAVQKVIKENVDKTFKTFNQ